MGFLLEEIRLTTERMYQTHCKWWHKLQNNLTLIGSGRISELEYGSEMIDPNTVQMWIYWQYICGAKHVTPNILSHILLKSKI